MSLHDDLLTAAAYLEGDGVTMEAAEADRIAGVFRSYATALCQQAEPVAGGLTSDQAVEVLRMAMDESGIAPGWSRAHLIGRFCNHWNAALSTSEGKTE